MLRLNARLLCVSGHGNHTLAFPRTRPLYLRSCAYARRNVLSGRLHGCRVRLGRHQPNPSLRLRLASALLGLKQDYLM